MTNQRSRIVLDEAEQCVWRDGARVEITPKAFAVLCYLADRPRRLVPKEELLDALWGDTVVTDGVLKVCVLEVRRALDDDAKSPRWIQTVHRRGYRFLEDVPRGDAHTKPSSASPALPSGPRAAGFVGREAELARLDAAAARALAGEATTVFVAGPPGIGKTSLVEAFLAPLERAGRVLVARGHCLEQYGAGDAWLPVLEAVGGLLRGPRGPALRARLERAAPSWATEFATNAGGTRRDPVLAATHERRLRELGDALADVARETPLVLLLEDVQWSDPSTLDLVALIARRREPARVLLVVTARPVDAGSQSLARLRHELALHRRAESIEVGLFDADATARWIDARFDGHAFPPELARELHARTDGHPLFLVHLADWIVERGAVARRGDAWTLESSPRAVVDDVPDTVRRAIELQADRLDADEQRVLEAGAACRAEFSVAAAAAALQEDPSDVEAVCEKLARRGSFLVTAGLAEMPDGTISSRYRFAHGLQAEVIYRRIAPGRRSRYHLRIGERGVELYGARAGEIASELALHFEEGRDWARAIAHRRAAAANDVRRAANREAEAHLVAALALCDRLGEGERAITRRALLEEVGLLRRTMGDLRGSAQAFEALAAHAGEFGDRAMQVHALLCLGSVVFWEDRERCLAHVDRAVEAAERGADAALRAHARGYRGHWHLNLRGFDRAHVAACEAAVESARAAGDERREALHVIRLAYARLFAGRTDDALTSAAAGAEMALAQGDAFEWLLAQFFRSWAFLHAGRLGEMRANLDAAARAAERNGHAPWIALFTVQRAELLVALGDGDGARALATPVVDAALGADEPTGQLAHHGGIVLVQADLAARDPRRAAERVRDVEARLRRERGAMDRLLDLPFHAAAFEAHHEVGDTRDAARHADALLEAARACGEPNHAALALAAQVACARGSAAATKRDEDEAVASIDSGSAPLLAPRAAELLARAATARRKKSIADAHARRATDARARLAESLEITASAPTRTTTPRRGSAPRRSKRG